MLKEELDELAHQSEGQFSVHYVLDEVRRINEHQSDYYLPYLASCGMERWCRPCFERNDKGLDALTSRCYSRRLRGSATEQGSNLWPSAHDQCNGEMLQGFGIPN